MPLLTASEALTEARTARARGDVDACLRLSALAIDKAKEERAPDTAFLAACAPGRLYINRGETREAAGWYRQALDIGLDFGLTRRLPEVYHDLYAACRDGEDTEQARRYFSTSCELYLDTNQRHPRIVALYADRDEGIFMRKPTAENAADAYRQWRSVPATLTEPAERFLAGCSLMVTTAWLDWKPQYDNAVQMMSRAYRELTSHEGTSLALSHAATGAIRARDYPGAASIAAEALRVAVERGEPVCEARARFVLDNALAERGSARLLA